MVALATILLARRRHQARHRRRAREGASPTSSSTGRPSAGRERGRRRCRADAQEHEPDIVMVMLDGYPGDAAARLADGERQPVRPGRLPRRADLAGLQRPAQLALELPADADDPRVDPRHASPRRANRRLVDAGVEAAGGRGFRRVADAGEALDVLHRPRLRAGLGRRRLQPHRDPPRRSLDRERGAQRDRGAGPVGHGARSRDQRGCSGPALEPPPRAASSRRSPTRRD